MDEEKRKRYCQVINQYKSEGKPLIYLDESGFQKDNLRSYGYSPKGLKCLGKFDWHIKNCVQAIGALLNNTLICVALVTGTVNGDVFKAWVEQLLIPTLPVNSVIIMDNASFHKVDGISKIFESNGHELLFLPPYCPDLNPIENKWAQVKAKRKELRTNDIDALFKDHFL